MKPHHIVTWGGCWYLVAWDLDRGDWRAFRADRITPHGPTGPRFAPRQVPGGAVAHFVTSRFRGFDWPCRGRRSSNSPPPGVSPFIHDGVVEELGPQRCRLTLGSWSWSWSWPGLAAAVGRFDADIHVIGPPELRAAFAQLARRYADAAADAGPEDADAAADAGRE
nr:WYL domain-containing protein [Micromonospora qiuiae]